MIETHTSGYVASVGAEGGVVLPGVVADDPIGAAAPVATAQLGVADLRRIAVRSAAYIFPLRLILQLFAWAVTILTARILLPYDYGVLTATGVFTNLADILAEAGILQALVHQPRLDDDDIAGAFTLCLMLSACMCGALWALAGFGASILQTPELTRVLPVVGLAMLLIPFRSVSVAILERRLQLRRTATIAWACSMLQGCLVLTLALAGFGYWSLIMGYMALRFVEVPILAREASWRPRLRWPGGRSNPIVSYGLHFTGWRICWFIYRNIDYAIVGRLMGPITLGYYSLAFMLISMPVDKIVGTTNRVAFPIFCRMVDDRERLRDWFLRLAVMFGFLATPALVGLALVAEDAILVVLGAKWLPAVVPLQIMSLAGVIMVLGSSVEVIYNATGRPDINFRFTALSVAVYPPLFYWCGSRWGITGVAMVWAICYPIMVLGLIARTRSITGIGVRDVVSSQLPIWASAALMALVVLVTGRLLRDVGGVPVRLGLSIAAGTLSYAAAIRLLCWESVMGNIRLTWDELKGRGVAAKGS